MLTPEPRSASWSGRPGRNSLGVLAALIALAGVVTLTASSSAPPGSPQGPALTAKVASDPSPTIAPAAAPAVKATGAASSAQGPITVVGVGDSVTAASVCNCESFVALYATRLAASRGMTTSAVNLGVGGWTSAQLLRSISQPGTFRDQVARADILLVTIGANDLIPLQARQPTGCASSCYLPLVNSVGNNVKLIVAAARAAHPDHPPTVLVTNYWDVFEDGDVGINKNGSSFEQWSDSLTRAENAQICDGAQLAGGTCVDLYAPFKGNGSKNPTALLAGDGDHPNAAGHQLIASTLLASTPLPLA